MHNRRKLLLAAGASILMLSSAVQATTYTPLVDVTVLGSSSQGGPYTDSISGSSAAGPLYVEIVAQDAPIGTVYSSGHTVTSLVTNEDGLSSLEFNVTGGAFTNFNVAAPTAPSNNTGAPVTTGEAYNSGQDQGVTNWQTGSGHSGGTTSGSGATSGVTGAYANQAATDSGTLPTSTDILWYGYLASGASASAVAASFDGTGGAKINGGTSVLLSSSQVAFTPLALNPIISLGTSAPVGLTSYGTITVSGSHAAGYQPATPATPNAASGYVQETGIGYSINYADPEFFALKLTGVGGNGQPIDSQIVTSINTAGNSTGVTASLISTSVFANTFSGYDILLTANAGALSSDQFLGFDFGTAFPGVDVVDISAVPEPTSLGLLALGGIALMRRRRVNRKPMGN